MSPVEFKKTPCCSVDFKGQWPQIYACIVCTTALLPFKECLWGVPTVRPKLSMGCV